MEMAVPRVSIGVPVYNGESYLAHTLDSILGQTFKDLEVIVSDNASTDRTEEICRAYATRDPRVRYYRHDVNRGAVWNHNRAFELAKGEFFKWNSADDYCGPEFVERCLGALHADPSAAMAVSEPVEVDEQCRPLAVGTVPTHTLLPAVPPNAPTHVRFRQNIRLDHMCLTIYALIRSDLMRKVGPMGSYADSDRIMLAHLSLYGHCIIIPETLLFNRDHAGRFSRSYNRLYDGWRERATWMDPSNAKRWVFPFWTELFQLFRIVRQTPLRLTERVRCYREIFRWLGYESHMRRLYIDATYYPRKWVVRHFPKAKVFWNWLWGRRNVSAQVGNAPSDHKVSS
jgi:glycosyltransferase involved in cell wall biosynthesis